MLARILLLVACFFITGDGAAFAAEEAFAEVYAELSLRMPTPTLLVACHGFGCANQAYVILSAGDRARLGEVKAGQTWAVDNWTRKYGEMPEVMPLDEWGLARCRCPQTKTPAQGGRRSKWLTGLSRQRVA